MLLFVTSQKTFAIIQLYMPFVKFMQLLWDEIEGCALKTQIKNAK